VDPTEGNPQAGSAFTGKAEAPGETRPAIHHGVSSPHIAGLDRNNLLYNNIVDHGQSLSLRTPAMDPEWANEASSPAI
jgi:hypothetical protein